MDMKKTLFTAFVVFLPAYMLLEPSLARALLLHAHSAPALSPDPPYPLFIAAMDIRREIIEGLRSMRANTVRTHVVISDSV
jgi:hypothetical protein